MMKHGGTMKNASVPTHFDLDAVFPNAAPMRLGDEAALRDEKMGKHDEIAAAEEEVEEDEENVAVVEAARRNAANR
jgi:hypothetical protein